MSASLDDVIERLDSLQQSFIQSQENAVPVTAKADAASNKIPQVDANTAGVATNAEDITDTQIGLADTYESMNDQVTQLEEALAEVYELVVG